MFIETPIRMISEYFKLAVKNIRKRKLRSWLTLLGIFISVAVIFILISLSLGLQYSIQEQFRQLGTDKFFVQPQGMFGPPGSGSAATFSVEDVNVIEKVSGVKEVTYMIGGNAKVEFDNEIRYFPVYGLPAAGINVYLESGSMKMLEGRTLTDSDVNKVILGYDYKFNKVFSEPVNLGSKIKINGVDFKVVGIVDRIGNPSDDKNIMMNVEDFKSLFNSGDRVDYIIVQIQDGQNINDIVERVNQKLMKFRDVTEKTKDFTILTPEQLLNSFQTILSIVTAFLISVAAISLIVGAIGIANTMYTSVLERTREIGVMKAVGAKNKDILLIFVIEAGLIGMIGGIIGVCFGVLVSKTIEYIAVHQIGTNLLMAATPAYLIIGCILFAFVIGAISGFLPARQASKTKIVDARRYE